MALYDYTLQNTGSEATINNKNPIWIRGAGITVAHKNLNQYPPNNSGELAELNQGGKENPNYVITGYVDQFANTTTEHTVNGVVSCSEAVIETIQQLKDLTQSANSKILFKGMYGTGGTAIIPIRGSANGTNGFNVAIDSFGYNHTPNTPVPRTTDSGKEWWQISLKLTEVP